MVTTKRVGKRTGGASRVVQRRAEPPCKAQYQQHSAINESRIRQSASQPFKLAVPRATTNRFARRVNE
eukprot:11322103-Alexandrium_andersonii.AAC.1